jgi:hypothetical protein
MLYFTNHLNNLCACCVPCARSTPNHRLMVRNTQKLVRGQALVSAALPWMLNSIWDGRWLVSQLPYLFVICLLI